MLKAENISIGYENKEVLSNVSFTINSATFVGIIGINGSGKSTLLKSLYGKIELLSGKVIYKDEIIQGPSQTLIAGHKNMKMVTQDSKVDLFMTCRENLETCFNQKQADFIKERIQFLESLFGLKDFINSRPKAISGGQKQRLALAMALAEPPEVLLLDEPFSQIDQIGAFELLKGLKEFQRMMELTIIMVSHQTSQIRMFSDRCLVLHGGTICQDDSYENIYRNPVNKTVARLTGYYGTLDNRIVRPEDVLLNEGSQEAIVVNSLRLAGSFLIEMNYDSQKIYSFSNSSIEPNTRVLFKLIN